MTYVDTATAVATTQLSYGTLRRYAKSGRLTAVPDPLDKRKVLWLEHQLMALEPSSNAPSVTEDNRADLASLRFLEIATAFEEGDRAKAEELVNNTPAALVSPLIQFAVVLAFTAIEDDVDAASSAEIAATGAAED